MPRRPTSHRGFLDNGPGTEADIIGCNHCEMQFVVKPPRGAVTHSVDMCGHCQRPICARCAKILAGPDGQCVPFIDRLTEWEARAALRKAAGV